MNVERLKHSQGSVGVLARVHTPSSPVRERETKKGGRERERGRESKREREREGER